MTVETYLQSEEAVADVALAIADDQAYLRSLPQGAWTGEGFWMSNERDFLPWHQIGHTRAHFSCASPPLGKSALHFLPVYFRPCDGDRYSVSDLGEAVRALRLRSGMVSPDIGSGAARIASALPEGVSCTDGVIYDLVPAAELPRALCRVLLAAHRVARLEVPGG